MFSLGRAKEWASGFIDGGGSSANSRLNLEEYLEGIPTQNDKHPYIQKSVDEKFQEAECRPTYEQLPQSSIVRAANRNLKVLQSLELLVHERMQAHDRFLSGLGKVQNTFEQLQDCDGTMRQAYDALFVYIEQESQQARQQQILGELKQLLVDRRMDCNQKLNAFSREVENLDKDVRAAEKKLSKSKEIMNKLLETKSKMDTKDLDREKRRAMETSVGVFEDRMQNIKSDMRAEKRKELTEQLTKAESDVATDIRVLRGAIRKQDDNHLLLRRAYQDVDVQSKNTIHTVLEKIVKREQESSEAKVETLEKLAMAVQNVNVETDIMEFIHQHATDDSDAGDSHGCLMLSSHSLTLLEDVMPQSVLNPSGGGSIKSRKGRSLSGAALAEHLEDTASGSFVTEREYPVDVDATDDDSQRNCTLHLTRLFYAGAGSDDTEEAREKRRSILSSSLSSLLSNASLRDTDDGENTSSFDANTTKTEPVTVSGDDVLHPLLDTPLVVAATQRNLDVSKRNAALSESAMPVDGFGRMTKLPNTSPLSILVHCRQYVINAPLEEKVQPGGGLSVEHSVNWLCEFVSTQAGRDIFVTTLNQFRSKKVDVGTAYEALGAVLWQTLDHCADAHDIHGSKVIMMLSQTFFRKKPAAASSVGENEPRKENGDRDGEETDPSPSVDSADSGSDTELDEAEDTGRGAKMRQYLKDVLTPHPIWNGDTFWEEVLVECVLEQLQMIPCEVPWHDMSTEDRREAVRRVHNVVMSQVMAVEHSMLELGCSQGHVRKFIYNMAYHYQLPESQKHVLLAHLQSATTVTEESV
eukprot:GSChrysophyteH1.ASY1.ANO1.305.1 assembled CDS